jgi:hypothetical protein
MEIQKHIEETENAKQLYKPANAETGTQSPAQKRRRIIMVALWDRMSKLYRTWERDWGDVNGDTIYAWTRLLSKFDELDIGGAIAACENRTDKFPLEFPEFKSLCVAARSAAKPNVTDQRIAEEKNVKSLEDFTRPKRGDGPVAKAQKERMARIHAGEDLETLEESYKNLELARRWGPLTSA